MEWTTAHAVSEHRRALRLQLDAEHNISFDGANLQQNQRFVTVRFEESFCLAPDTVVNAAKSLLSRDFTDTVSKTVRDVVVFKIGCNLIPLFANSSGGRGRSLHSFHCVYADCLAFIDIRMFRGNVNVKWLVMGVSHAHGFEAFPTRMPRDTIDDDVKERIVEMALARRPCAAIKMDNDVFCNKDVFYNVIRKARSDQISGQARALRDAAMASDLWSSEIHLGEHNTFVEAFFSNTNVCSRRVDFDLVYVDDTACTNIFMLPVIVVLGRDCSNNVHVLSWGLLRNRTVESFERFFVFTARFFPGLTCFVCDRSISQKQALRRAFGCSVRIFHCVVHIGRNIKRNAGANSSLLSLFWKMRYERSEESGRRFLGALRERHETKPSVFTTQLLSTLESFLPPMVDGVLKAPIFPQLGVLETIDMEAFDVASVDEHRAFSTLLALKRLPVFCHDVFSRDNTNAIECFFQRDQEENARRECDTAGRIQGIGLLRESPTEKARPFRSNNPTGVEGRLGRLHSKWCPRSLDKAWS